MSILQIESTIQYNDKMYHVIAYAKQKMHTNNSVTLNTFNERWI